MITMMPFGEPEGGSEMYVGKPWRVSTRPVGVPSCRAPLKQSGQAIVGGFEMRIEDLVCGRSHWYSHEALSQLTFAEWQVSCEPHAIGDAVTIRSLGMEAEISDGDCRTELQSESTVVMKHASTSAARGQLNSLFRRSRRNYYRPKYPDFVAYIP